MLLHKALSPSYSCSTEAVSYTTSNGCLLFSRSLQVLIWKISKAYELYSVGEVCAVHEAVSTLNLLIPFQTVSSVRTKCHSVSFLVPSSFQWIFARDPSVETCLIKDVLTFIWVVSWNRAGWVAGADCLSGDWENVLIFCRSSTSCLCFWSKLVSSSSRSLFWAEGKKYRKLKLCYQQPR